MLSPERDKLNERRVMVEVRQHRQATISANAWDAELLSMDGQNANEAVDVLTYYHIGNAVLSPWGATFKQLRLAENQSSLEPGEVQLVDYCRTHLLKFRICFKNTFCYKDISTQMKI